MNAIRNIRHYWVSFFLCCLLGSIASTVGVGVVASRPPLVLLDIHEVDSVAVVGGSLDLMLTLIRSRDCDATVQRWLWEPTKYLDRNGKVVRRYVSLPAAANPPTPLGEETTYILSLPMPSNVHPGKWFYWSRTYDGCWLIPSLTPTSRTSPNTLVTITEPPPPSAVPGIEQLVPEDQQPRDPVRGTL